MSVFSKQHCISERLGLWVKQGSAGVEGLDMFTPRTLFSSGFLCRLAEALWSVPCCQLNSSRVHRGVDGAESGSLQFSPGL